MSFGRPKSEYRGVERGYNSEKAHQKFPNHADILHTANYATKTHKNHIKINHSPFNRSK
jgi:hypothetical protein